MAEQEYDLMHKDDVVASLQLDDLSGAIRKVTPSASPELLPLGGSQGADSLRKWWLRRAVPISQGNIAALLQQRTEVLTDIPEKLDFFDELPEYDTALYVHKKSKTDEAGSLEMLRAMLPVFEGISDWCDENILAAMTGMAEKCECKNAKVMWPVRIAAAGKAVTPGGAVEICRILGKDETLRRMRVGIEKLEKSLG